MKGRAEAEVSRIGSSFLWSNLGVGHVLYFLNQDIREDFPYFSPLIVSGDLLFIIVQSKCSHATSDVKPSSYCARLLYCKYFIYGEVEAPIIAGPSGFLSSSKVKTVVAIVKTFLSMHTIDGTRIVLAGICCPNNR
ncbi:unnamed protein product [Fraxinus pennsylvanica]|uniref:Uncharacterized protein n=1 Tax=Fraxinus pennsylvanica TaxID=56036 RepID=A0AAD2ACL6_9LAMI|nr:unnamed protein product [Fraxinus pennsylvanica]